MVDKCYKLHGRPLGYKRRQKPGLNNETRSNNQENCAMVNHISKQQVSESVMDQTQGNVGNFMQTLSLVQY